MDHTEQSRIPWRFNRHEIAGALGDLGTLLPLGIGLVIINGLDPTALLLTVGLYYILSGLYFRTTMPVQPMKVISAYAIASAATPIQITAAGMLAGLCLLFLAGTGAIRAIGRLVARPVVRGVQLTTGMLLIVQGVRFMLGESALQQAQGSAEPFLLVSAIGPIPIGIVLGIVSVLVILLLLENRVAPAALVVVVGGAAAGLALGAGRALEGFQPGLHLPSLLPFGWPAAADLAVAIFALTLPQLPMTLGNAVIAQADLSHEYFGKAARRITLRSLTTSMGLANVVCALMGGMPLCHGAGGLAAHYRFGARSTAANLIIGTLILVTGLLVGDQATRIFGVLPLSMLGALLVFAGLQLGLMILDVKERRDLFVVIAILGVALATNLAIGFIAGILLSFALRSTRLKV